MMWISCGRHDCQEWVKANAESWARRDIVHFVFVNVLNGSDLKIYLPVNQYQTPSWARTELSNSVSTHKEMINHLGSRDLPIRHPLQACHTSRWFKCHFIISCLPIKWTAIPWIYTSLQIHSKVLRTNNLTGLETLQHPWVQYESLFESFFIL